MSGKRSRQVFEADLKAQHSPFVFFGTALPPQDGETRDDGSYVPIHLQEVRDEKGRRRLHGAFTGGWSAGYFNTVGSKEGWTPAAFVSSPATRSRRKDGPPFIQQRPEDFMDEEDLADAANAESIQTRHAYSGLGLTEHDERRSGIRELFLPEQCETMGFQLLKKMGWKDDQGIGPKVRRMARLGTSTGDESYMFAPDRVSMICFTRKLDRKGLGWGEEVGMVHLQRSRSEDGEDVDAGNKHKQKYPRMTLCGNSPESTQRNKGVAGGIGVGILNDTGSDDEDPYEIGPRISYNRVIGADKKKRKKIGSTPMAANPMVKSRPTFVPKKAAISGTEDGLRSPHGGRPPLQGFVQVGQLDALVSMANSGAKYAPPAVPPGWKSSRANVLRPSSGPTPPRTGAMAALDFNPKSRAALLGEKPLPGKSVFDYLTPAARERLASASGRSDLPPAKAEAPVRQIVTEDEKLRDVMRQLPVLQAETAIAVITRGLNSGTPYRDDEAKQGRYRSYLEHFAGFGSPMPSRPTGMTIEAFTGELREFYNCATIFKPMTGAMASRFTTSQAPPGILGESGAGIPGCDLPSKALPKPTNPTEEAAKVGMYGSLTRSVQDFFPLRLLCKRFNVKAPDHAQSEMEPSSTTGGVSQTTRYWDGQGGRGLELPPQGVVGQPLPPEVVEPEATGVMVTLERRRADDDVFKAVFGNDSDDETS